MKVITFLLLVVVDASRIRRAVVSQQFGEHHGTADADTTEATVKHQLSEDSLLDAAHDHHRASVEDGDQIFEDMDNSLNITVGKDKCRRKAKVYKWFGTAPICRGNSKDCTSRGMKVETYCKDCNGAVCRSGKKVKCYKWDKNAWNDECDVECSAAFSRNWVGTAPFCGASDCDCFRINKLPVTSATSEAESCKCSDQSRCETFGSTCTTGRKIMCALPKGVKNAALNKKLAKAIAAAKRDCTKRDKISSKNKQAALKAGAAVAIAFLR